VVRVVVEEGLLKAAQARPRELFKVVIWGGFPTLSQRLVYYEESAREKARILSETLFMTESAAENLLGLAETVEAIFPALPAFVTSMRGDSLLDIERNPTRFPFIYRIEPVRTVRALLNVSAPMIGAPKAWELGYSGKGVKIAVVDTGIDAYYSLEKKVSEERSFVGDRDGKDVYGHGTHVAGIAAGNEDVYRGVAPGAGLISAKVLDNNGFGSDYQVALGISWAFERGAQVINLSLGGKGHPQDLLSRLCNTIAERGVVVVAAAGNSGEEGIESPGIAEKLITVGAVDKKGRVTYYSSRDVQGYGKPDVVAPGGLLKLEDGTVLPPNQGVVSLRSRFSGLDPYPDEKHASLVGTSMATPHVSGAAAILIEALRERGFEGNLHYAVKNLLKNTAKDLHEPRNAQGSGLIDLEKALKTAKSAEPKELGEITKEQAQSMLDEVTKSLMTEALRGITYTVAQQLVSSLFQRRLSPAAEGDLVAEIHRLVEWLRSETERLVDSYRRGLINYQEYQARMTHLNAITSQLYSLLQNISGRL
jgi:subtilisin family serine protease